MDYPRSVKVGTTTYAIKRDSFAIRLFDMRTGVLHSAFSAHDEALIVLPESQESKYEDDFSPDFLKRLFLHEIQHCIFRQWGMPYGMTEQSNEENVCDVSADGWLAFIRDNPEVVAWLAS